MILINKYETDISIDDSFVKCIAQNDELAKIYDFIDLPENIRLIEQNNSAILRNYYANALDNNLVDVKTVKYIINKNLIASNLSERAIEQYQKAEQFLNNNLSLPLTVNLVTQVYKICIADVYELSDQVNLFNNKIAKPHDKLSLETEIELENLFDFLNGDNEFHPILQGWMMHFKLLNLPLFTEGKTRIISLLHNFWLRKNQIDLFGLLSIEHELYIHKNKYIQYFFEHKAIEGEILLSEQMTFGLEVHTAQLNRSKQLLKSYFRKQVDFEKLNPRQKNIMNYVFERGYKLKEIDDSILNKRQKLIMYIVQHKGFVSTKDLVSEFDCNRKTIQRDFTLLLELGLVKSIGAGAGLRYCINLQETQNPLMDIYQADFVKMQNNDEVLEEED